MGEAALNPRKERRDLGKNADQAEINLEILGKILGILPPCARAGGEGTRQDCKISILPQHIANLSKVPHFVI